MSIGDKRSWSCSEGVENKVGIDASSFDDYDKAIASFMRQGTSTVTKACDGDLDSLMIEFGLIGNGSGSRPSSTSLESLVAELTEVDTRFRKAIRLAEKITGDVLSKGGRHPERLRDAIDKLSTSMEAVDDFASELMYAMKYKKVKSSGTPLDVRAVDKIKSTADRHTDALVGDVKVVWAHVPAKC